jgi:predicted metal-binding membrane protein
MPAMPAEIVFGTMVGISNEELASHRADPEASADAPMMMAPSAEPMILTYARVGRQGKAEGKPFAATGWFAAGYFLAWTGFSLAPTFFQWVIERAALLDSDKDRRRCNCSPRSSRQKAAIAPDLPSIPPAGPACARE